MRLAAYVYPGWHPVEERGDFDEWDLVYGCRPRFPGHLQPRLPAGGRYDDRDPVSTGQRLSLAAAHGIDAFVYGFFWCRGKRVFQDALDLGFLGSSVGGSLPFALMWANRMPRRVLPVRRADAPVIEGDRLVSSDIDDFVRFIAYVAERYFMRPNYLRTGGKPYLSIFDSTFFVRELGLAGATAAVTAARAWLARNGFPGLHLAAIDPAAELSGQVAAVGFDSVTNYVLLPYWRGPSVQDYADCAARRAGEWAELQRISRLPYHPSVSPGWDASPRGADFGPARPDKYPWSPVVTGEHPALFKTALSRAVDFGAPLTFIASLNEWSEGHYLEPDERHGLAWLEAVAAARR